MTSARLIAGSCRQPACRRRPLGKRRLDDGNIIKRQDLGADDLAGLMPLACHHQYIPYIKFPDGLMNGLAPVADLDGARA